MLVLVFSDDVWLVGEGDFQDVVKYEGIGDRSWVVASTLW